MMSTITLLVTGAVIVLTYTVGVWVLWMALLFVIAFCAAVLIQESRGGASS